MKVGQDESGGETAGCRLEFDTPSAFVFPSRATVYIHGSNEFKAKNTSAGYWYVGVG